MLGLVRAVRPVLARRYLIAVAQMEDAARPCMLDREAFNQTIALPALTVPKQSCHKLMSRFRGFTFDRPKTRCVVPDPDSTDHRLLLLRENLNKKDLSAELLDVIDVQRLEWRTHAIVLDYSHLSADVVLKALLPALAEIPSAFETVGHIAHLNLRDECLPYKSVIGQVLLDKNPHIKTVVNKLGSIENEYRMFQMEVLAGEPKYVTEVVQNKNRFVLDFSKVYWNSRLEAEHKRLVSLFNSDDVICDMMAGIGPFAIPAALKGCKVYANDLNPDSYFYLKKNAALNKVADRIRCYNMDARQFIKQLLSSSDTDWPPSKGELTSASTRVSPEAPPSACGTSAPVVFQHVVMNLPASAVEFLDVFRGLFRADVWRGRLPWVHCYAFAKMPEGQPGLLAKVEHFLGAPLGAPPRVVRVREVAPNKSMLCVTFRLPEAVAFADTRQPRADAAAGAATNDADATKRRKVM